MVSVNSDSSLVSPSYGAAEFSSDATVASAAIADSSGRDPSWQKYELPPSQRPTLGILVDAWLQGSCHIFDPEYGSRDKQLGLVKAKVYNNRLGLKQDAENFFSDRAEEGLTQQRVFAPRAPNAGSHDLGAHFVGLLDDCPGLVLGEGHSQVAARKLLIENMPALKARGVEHLYLEHLLTDVHGDDLAVLNESPHNQISPRLTHYLQAQTNGQGMAYSPRPALANKYGYMAVVEAAHRAGIKVIAIDCAASYFLEGGEGNRDDADHWRIPLMNYFSYQVLSGTGKAGDLASPPGRDDKWVALVGSTHMSRYDGIPGLSELMGVPGLRFEEAKENHFDVDPGHESHHWPCFSGNKKNILLKGDFLFKVDVQEDSSRPSSLPAVYPNASLSMESDSNEATPNKITKQQPSFLARAFNYLSCYPGRGTHKA